MAAAPNLGGAVEGGNATSMDWILLGVFLFLAIGVSFLCSLLEASLLTLGPTEAKLLTDKGRRAGPILESFQENVDRPLTAILTLNTLAHTFGAMGIGGQTLRIFGSEWVMLASVVVTLLILVLSEIVPKTLGATYARKLATFTAITVQLMIYPLTPFIWLMNQLSRFIGGGHQQKISRSELKVLTEMGHSQGTLDQREHDLIRNLLALREVHAEDIMTPRNVVTMLSQDATIEEVLADPKLKKLSFSRMPVNDGSPDSVVGVVTRRKILMTARQPGGLIKRIGDIAQKVYPVPEQATVADVLDQIKKHGVHFLLVVDEFGGTAGVVTLEDCLETLLGDEFVDESDEHIDMRAYARKVAEEKRKRRGGQISDSSEIEDAGGPSGS